MSNGHGQANLIVFANFAGPVEVSAQFKFCVAVVIKGKGARSGSEGNVCVQKEWIFVQKFATIAALRNLDRCRSRTASAKQVAITDLHTAEYAFVSIEAPPKTKFL